MFLEKTIKNARKKIKCEVVSLQMKKRRNKLISCLCYEYIIIINKETFTITLSDFSDYKDNQLIVIIQLELTKLIV